MISKQLQEFIMTELNDEWWSDGHVKFLNSAEKMLKAGMSEDDIKMILEDLYSAVQDEFN